MSIEGIGRLYIVSTPIGNLADITYRAVKTLRWVQFIAAEDTRRTRILLNKYNIETSVSSYNSYNKSKKGPVFVRKMEQGADMALVSDAGTPGLSDPLYHLVQSTLKAGLSVNTIPGPAAALAALTVSGLPMDRFSFEGFLPRKKRRTKTLEALAAEPRTVVLYESPRRLSQTLRDLYAVMGDRQVAITRELTKVHEEVIHGRLSDLAGSADQRKWKGEITLVIAGAAFGHREIFP